mmetsp:Transcript_35565/g.84396  ORF Transcript_35565/g.84396 Transcript_35565/m.84396 type:complete len:315 (-) Transcript_35565:161-1105(-)
MTKSDRVSWVVLCCVVAHFHVAFSPFRLETQASLSPSFLWNTTLPIPFSHPPLPLLLNSSTPTLPSHFPPLSSAYFFMPICHSCTLNPMGVFRVTGPSFVSGSKHLVATLVQWSPQLQSSKKSILSNRTPVISRRIGKCVAALSEDNGGDRPIWLTSLPPQAAVRQSHTVTPGTTSSIFSAWRPIFTAKGVSADEAAASFIPGYFPSWNSCSASRAPGCREILSEPLMTPLTPSPLPFKSPTTLVEGIESSVYISWSHKHASKSKTTISGYIVPAIVESPADTAVVSGEEAQLSTPRAPRSGLTEGDVWQARGC